jgi:AraC-like DNA-binding protein
MGTDYPYRNNLLDSPFFTPYTGFMTYYYYSPAAPLRPFINGYYFLNEQMPYQRERILPIPSLDLKINFGGALKAYDKDDLNSKPFAVCGDSWWMGLWNQPHMVDWPMDVQVLIVDFKPGGAYPFLRVPLIELQNRVVSLDTMWGQFANELRERLQAAPTIQARFTMLDSLFLKHLSDIPSGFDAVFCAVNQIIRNDGILSIRWLSEDIGMSQKHLIAQFKQMVGTTPKELARLCRFQHVLRSIDVSQAVDWTFTAHEFHYFDQSHFNKDFETFIGHSPSDYLRLRRQVQAENPQHARYLRQVPII